MAPVILAAHANPRIQPLVVSTGQHREMLKPILQLFQIKPDVDLELMQPNQTLASLTARAMQELDRLLAREKPDAVAVQGDTTTAMVAAMAAFYARIPVAHVEAGLRSDRLDAPYPEEMNRRVIGQIARWHFPPTPAAAENLYRDGIDRLGGQIIVTGNTVIDALQQTRKVLDARPMDDPILGQARAWKSHPGRRMILVTGHRRENFGEPFREFCLGLRDIAEAQPNCLLVYPVHLNPNVQAPVRELLAGTPNVVLTEPAGYPVFVSLMLESDLIITDSGGVQEEGPALGKPVLVTRDVTERPEAVEAGGVLLVGPHRARLFAEANRLLGDDILYRSMAVPRSPYGDGHASERCMAALLGESVQPFALH